MSEQLLWVLLSACVLWKTIFGLQHLDVLYLPVSLRSLYNYSINTRANFCSVPILQRALNRAAQQDPWDIITEKKEAVWVKAKLHIDVFHPEDCEVFGGEYRVIIVAEILLYCRVTPRFPRRLRLLAGEPNSWLLHFDCLKRMKISCFKAAPSPTQPAIPLFTRLIMI